MAHDGGSDSHKDDKSSSYKLLQLPCFIDEEQPPMLADICGGDIPIIKSFSMRLPNNIITKYHTQTSSQFYPHNVESLGRSAYHPHNKQPRPETLAHTVW